MAVKTLGIISDTHLRTQGKPLPPVVLKTFAGCDLICHAGDILEMGILNLLGSLAPVVAVAGNNDPAELHQELGDIQTISTGGVQILICHGHQGSGSAWQNIRRISASSKAELIIFGHSHQPLVHPSENRLFINPGSPTVRRREPAFSVAIARIEDGRITPQIIRWQ
ncbi:MAG: metallophosphatase family protein [Bacteroidetes bacterium]|nr:metallophosphatase family protein [Bacteroidota bacterium]